ncbi:MAG TPA: hypothetical protein VJ124_05450 [Pyrinomonadaceae bacterium]|nr:hypothetical protein [Pyrinomonadaceae bacterium]
MNVYEQYLQSDTWKQRRQATIERANYRCEICGERDGLQVHHLNYERLGNERPSDLKVVCQGCHWIADSQRKDPDFELPPGPPNAWENIQPYEGKIKGKDERRMKGQVWSIDRRTP